MARKNNKPTADESGPTGNERMRRRAPKRRTGSRSGAGMLRVKDGFSEPQLKEMGAISLEWNELEEWSGILLTAALDLDSQVATQVTKSIHGLDARFSIIGVAFRALRAPPEIQSLVTSTLTEISEYKKIRDLIEHCRMWNEEAGIAYSQDAKARTWEVLVTASALEVFYERICALKWEIIDIAGIFSALSQRTRWVSFADSFLKSEEERRAHEEQRRQQSIRERVAQLKDHQKKRKSLPRLPMFPDAHAVRKARVETPRSRPSSPETT